MRITLGFWGSLLAISIGCSVSETIRDPIVLGNTGGVSAGPVLGGAAVAADTPPPPLTGGTVRIIKTGSGAFAVVSNPDEDAVHIVSLGTSPQLVGTVQLQRSDEPNRIVGDSQGHAWVVLRGGSAIAEIDLASQKLLTRTNVCPAPRGIDYDPSIDSLYVACATGELVTVSTTGQVTRSVRLDMDLRDVMVSQGQLHVSRFRSSELLTVDGTGAIIGRVAPAQPSVASTNGANMSAVVAWRTRYNPLGGIVMVNELASNDALVVVPANTYYAETGGSISVSAMSKNGGQADPIGVEQAIDVAFDGAGNPEFLSLQGGIQTGAGNATANVVYLNGNPGFGGGITTSKVPTPEYTGIDDGNTIGVPWVAVHQRSPSATLLLFQGTLPAGTTYTSSAPTPNAALTLSTNQHVDTGFDIFHLPTRVGTACMNCHPEGGDDGHAWKFNLTDSSGTVLEVRLRRTQSLLGGETTVSAPYHWDGDLPDLSSLMNEVFTHRMGGGQLTPEQAAVLARWLNAVPPPPQRSDLDPASVSRGAALFNGTAGCNACHAGGYRAVTGNQDIGKTDLLGSNKALKVPMLLGVGSRAPYMHDGCAATLMDRLTNPACAGSQHGNTATLAQSDLGDLETYLESL